MNRCAMQQSALAAWEEVMRGPLAGSDRKNNAVHCPKPRRFGPVHAPDPVRPIRLLHTKYQPEIYDSKPGGVELFDVFMGDEQGHVASSPPFFCGSPPSRASNPLVHDPRFGELEPPVHHLPAQTGSKSRSGCGARVKSGFEPAVVRVEGFDCLDRRADARGRGHGIAAVA
uniref:Uncharacterized protein n=1 Tax=Ananas comosus var. bracteatus TaxID=296719 RepID=A0A6V7NWD9_ANACO|nr:unnamed protein product [Ananas comosus var. bracteatus]